MARFLCVKIEINKITTTKKGKITILSSAIVKKKSIIL